MALKLTVELVALDTRDPAALADFYSQLLDVPITRKDDDWIEIGTGDIKVAFQLAPDHVAPQWPDPSHPQQMHLDIDINGGANLAEAEALAFRLGATRLPSEEVDGNSGFRVYADPAGHPFCLVWR